MNLTLQTISSTIISELLANSPLDGVVLDMEHGNFNNESLYACIQVITLYKKQCFVRVTDLNKTLVRMCLDAGATGIIFSTIESYSQGKEIVEFCTYPLFKGKRGCGLVRENQWGEYSLGTNKPLIIGQIETQTAVDNLDSICTCGFDMFIIGPYDLSNSLNCVGDWQNLLYKMYISKIYNTIDHKKIGMFLPSKGNITEFLSNKKNNMFSPALIIWGMDTELIKSGINSIAYDIQTN
jgi:2-keto-3-deoxy-L-rhamnonate aldolase RhmA